MERREFIIRSASAVGGALGLGLLDGCATAGGIRFDEAGPDIDGYLSGLDRQVSQIQDSKVDAHLIKHLKKRGLPESYFQDNLSSLLVVGAFRDLPPSLQAEPRMQERIQQETPKIGRQVLQMASYLDELSAEERASIQEFVDSDPEIMDLMHQGMVGNAASNGLESQRVKQFSRMLTDVHWRLSHQDPSLIIDETVDRTDRLCCGVGVQKDDWRTLLQDARDDLPPDAASSQLEAAPTVALIGGMVMGIGVGMAAVAYGAAYSPDTAFFTVGGILAMVGLSLLIIAAALDYVKKKRDRCNRQSKK